MKLELEVLARTSIKRKKPWPRTAFIGEVRPHTIPNKFYHAGFVSLLLRGDGELNSFRYHNFTISFNSVACYRVIVNTVQPFIVYTRVHFKCSSRTKVVDIQ